MFGINSTMQQIAGGSSTNAGPAPKRSRIILPWWGIVIIGGVAVAALVFAATLQAEVASIQSEESGLASRQLFKGTVNVTQEIAPGNSSGGYYGSAQFGSPLGNGNPLVLEFTFLITVGPPVTLEFDVCSNVGICSVIGGDLHLVPLSPDVSGTQVALEPATGFYELYALNLPQYAYATGVAPFAMQVNVTLLGQLNLHS
jgi:hypothetical protein